MDLKEFQRHTVDKLKEKFLNGTRRFLLADEVGLGKTVVAQNLVGEFWKSIFNDKNEENEEVFRVFYIAPNLSLAGQNRDRLEPGIEEDKLKSEVANVDRLSLLHKEEIGEDTKLKIYSLTPGTSLNIERLRGNREEKELLAEIFSYSCHKPEKRIFYNVFFRGPNKYGSSWDISDFKNINEDRSKVGWGKLKGKIKESDELKKKLEKLKFGGVPVEIMLNKIREEALVELDVKSWEELGRLQEEKKRNTQVEGKIKNCFEAIDKWLKKTYPNELENDKPPTRGRLIGYLVRKLSKLGVDYLESGGINNQVINNLVILDEFHRYEHLFEKTDEKFNNSVFEKFIEKSNVLLMSATPYSAYSETEGEHFEEFKNVLQFLYPDKEDAKETIDSLNSYSDDLEDYFENKNGKENSKTEHVKNMFTTKKEIEKKLKEVMFRTERYHFIRDVHKGIYEMPLEVRKQNKEEPGNLENKKDVILRACREYQQLNQSCKNGPKKFTFLTGSAMGVNFWKSGSRLLSFLSPHYKIVENLIEEDSDSEEYGSKILTAEASDFIENIKREKQKDEIYFTDNENLNNSEQITICNEKMKYLESQVFPKDKQNYLWLPPRHIRYTTGDDNFFEDEARYLCGEMEGHKHRQLSEIPKKMLIFSGWHFVPDYISGMISKKWNERIGEYSEKYSFTFRKNLGHSRFIYPSIFLAETVGYPHVFESGKEISVAAVIEKTVEKLKKILKKFSLENSIGQWEGDGVLDKVNSPKSKKKIFKILLSLDFIYLLEKNEKKEVKKRYKNLMNKIKNMVQTEKFSYIPEDIFEGKPLENFKNNLQSIDLEVLAYIALFSPAINIVRQLTNLTNFEGRSDFDDLECIWEFSFGRLIKFLEQDHVKALIETSFDKLYLDLEERQSKNYTDRILPYFSYAHFPEVIEEYLYILAKENIDVKGSKRVKSILNDLEEVLGVQAGQSNYYIYKDNKRLNKQFTTRFAMAFKDQKSTDEEEEDEEEKKEKLRTNQLRKAFNSPFFPFVLTTTSVGQEGLDFHYYCRDVMHWNLPTNPVDLEQREGRINRYDGLLIRKNIIREFYRIVKENNVDSYNCDNFWEKCVKTVEKDSLSLDRYNRELFPHWLFGMYFGDNQQEYGDHEFKLIRHTPFQFLSVDRTKYKNLKRLLSCYRLALGQTRQEEFLHNLTELNGQDNSDSDEVNKFTLNLSPHTPAEYVKWAAKKLQEEIKNEKNNEQRINRIKKELQFYAEQLNKKCEEKQTDMERFNKCKKLAYRLFCQLVKELEGLYNFEFFSELDDQLSACVVEHQIELNNLGEYKEINDLLERIIYFINPFVEIPNYLEGGYEDDKEVLKNGLEEYLENDS